MKTYAFTALILLAVSAFAGCAEPTQPTTQPGNAVPRSAPGVDTSPSGRTVHLKATVVDLQQIVAPGLLADLWAFCFAPADPKDKISVAAVEPWTPLPGDVAAGAPEGYACSVPGPTLRVQQGDRVIVEFANTHPHPHSIHWHGQLVPWNMDGAPGVSQDSVVEGATFKYDFIAKKSGTLWYHCHVDAQQHIMKGLYGAIIVEPSDKSGEPKDIDREYVWVLSTANRAEIMEVVPKVDSVPTEHAFHVTPCISGTQGCEQPASAAGNPDVFMINGHSYPLTMEQMQTMLMIKAGERIRLRIINAGETLETIHPHGHDMLITHRDGNLLPPGAQYFVDTLDIAPAQRIDVVIAGDNPGPWMIHTHVTSHETNCHKSSGGMHSMLVYEGFEDKMHGFKAEASSGCSGENPSVTYVLSKVLDATSAAKPAAAGIPHAVHAH